MHSQNISKIFFFPIYVIIVILLLFFIKYILSNYHEKASLMNSFIGNSYDFEEIIYVYDGENLYDKFGNKEFITDEQMNKMNLDRTKSFFIKTHLGQSNIFIYDYPRCFAPSRVIFCKNSINNFMNFSEMYHFIEMNSFNPVQSPETINTLAFLAYWGVLDNFLMVFTQNSILGFISNEIFFVIPISEYQKLIEKDISSDIFPIIVKKTENLLRIRTSNQEYKNEILKSDLPYNRLLFFEYPVENDNAMKIISDLIKNKQKYNFPIINEDYISKIKKICTNNSIRFQD